MPGNDAFDSTNDLPEYVAECDEHLTAARRTLLAIESDPGTVDRDQLDELFRNFHTIKGLSGMVGVRDAELVAHQLESFLGAIREGQAILAADGVEVLLDGVTDLEKVIVAHRDQAPPPNLNPLIARLTDLLPGRSEVSTTTTRSSDWVPPDSSATTLSSNKQQKLDAAIQQGSHAWFVTFTPSSDQFARGVTVHSVRERLKAVGEIVQAEPVTSPGGGIKFTFLVITTADDFAGALQSDGLVVEPYAAVTRSAPLPASGGPGRTHAILTPKSLVRVDLGRLDDLMRVVGELVITRARLENGLGRVSPILSAPERRELQETSLTMERQLRDLRDGVMRVRLVPIRDVFGRMRLVVRDVARQTGKDVDLDLTGAQTEVDKFVVERLADPLLHLVRNAVSHGLESPAERAAAGKPPRGRLELRAAAAGGAIVIEVEDDGRGIDSEQVYTRARALGHVPADAPTNPAGVLDLICEPGFSTRDTADWASGRGVGMDVVRRAIEELGGTLTLMTRPGLGTRFTARLPLTLAIAQALIVAVDDQTYAVPQTAVREVVQVESGMTTTLENNELLRRPEGVLPLVRVADLFGAARPTGAYPALVVGEGAAAVALGTDRVLGLREIVVRPLSDPLVQVPGLAGATELGDGRAVLILDAAGLARFARTRRRPA